MGGGGEEEGEGQEELGICPNAYMFADFTPVECIFFCYWLRYFCSLTLLLQILKHA